MCFADITQSSLELYKRLLLTVKHISYRTKYFPDRMTFITDQSERFNRSLNPFTFGIKILIRVCGKIYTRYFRFQFRNLCLKPVDNIVDQESRRDRMNRGE